MRFLLLVLGMIGIVLGIVVGNGRHPENLQQGAAMAIVGAVFFAAGAAAVDIVDAIKRARQ
jgi:drug/metabolite transporter (DMT)-like permease